MILFKKYQGAGNDFVLIDNRSSHFPLENRSLIKKMCHRQYGIGGDGLILLEHPTHPSAHFRMRIFNSDGSEASMCGNGLRCLVQFIYDIEQKTELLIIETKRTLHRCQPYENEILTELGVVDEIAWEKYIHDVQIYAVNTGEPHLVQFVDQVDSVNVAELGSNLRHSPHFSPEGANVNFVQKLSSHLFALRTYERGVEGETLACGTGSAAVGYVVSKRDGLQGPIQLQTRSGSILTYTYRDNSAFIVGPASFIFEGTYRRI